MTEQPPLVGPHADPVYDLVSSKADETNEVHFAARQSGLYRSDDGGVSWKGVFESLNVDTPLSTSCIGLSPNFQHDKNLFAAVAGGVLRSEDGGKQWTVAVFPTPAPFISSLAISPGYVEDGIVFAGTMEDGVFRSADRGARWTAWNVGLFDHQVFCLSISPNFEKDNTIFAGTESGVFKSTNGGFSWGETTFPVEKSVISLRVSPGYEKEGTILAGTESSGLFISNDRGATWKAAAPYEKTGTINAILLSNDFPRKAGILIMNDATCVVSRDFGKSWKTLNLSLPPDNPLLSISASEGIEQEAPILLGTASGEVLRVVVQ